MTPLTVDNYPDAAQERVRRPGVAVLLHPHRVIRFHIVQATRRPSECGPAAELSAHLSVKKINCAQTRSWLNSLGTLPEIRLAKLRWKDTRVCSVLVRARRPTDWRSSAMHPASVLSSARIRGARLSRRPAPRPAMPLASAGWMLAR
jgi:hypothetical protein